MIKVQAVNTNKIKTFVGRIYPGVDLIEGIKEICEKNNIEYGVIPTIIGSLSSGCIVYAIPHDGNKLGIKYSDPVHIEGPLELLCCQGFIGKGEDGEFQIHLHGLLADKDMRVIGGHFVSQGNIVLATAEVMIHAVEDAGFIRKYDEETGFPLFNFIKINEK